MPSGPGTYGTKVGRPTAQTSNSSLKNTIAANMQKKKPVKPRTA